MLSLVTPGAQYSAVPARCPASLRRRIASWRCSALAPGLLSLPLRRQVLTQPYESPESLHSRWQCCALLASLHANVTQLSVRCEVSAPSITSCAFHPS